MPFAVGVVAHMLTRSIASSRGVNATTVNPSLFSAARSRGQSRMRAYGVRSTLPIDVRMALRYSGSQHVSLKTTLAPKAAALRNALPTLSGSVIASSTSRRSACRATSSSDRSVGRSAIAIQPRCRLKPVSAVNSSVSQIKTGTSCGKLESDASRARYDATLTSTDSTRWPASRSRPTTRRPSATKRFRRRSNSPSDTFR